MKNPVTIIIAVVVLILIIIAAYFFFIKGSTTPAEVPENTTATGPNGEVTAPVDKTKTVIGKSVEGRDLTAYHYGEGETEILFVGGIHGGYGANTVLVAYELMDYLAANPTKVSANEKVTVIPVVNPDGPNKVVGTAERFTESAIPTSEAATVPGRFNAHTVDLNRNFDCDWQANATWQSKSVSGGTAAFSEPESQAVRAYIETHKPTAVVVWYSAAGGVYASNCHDGVLPETDAITKVYAKASGYPAHSSFNFYEITGDMVNWLAKEKIPAISVLLTNHEDVEWSKNQAGVDALLEHYAK